MIDHPVLKLDKLTLEPKELAKIQASIDGPLRDRPLRGNIHEQLIEPIIIELHLELFVITVDQVGMGTFLKRLACRGRRM